VERELVLMIGRCQCYCYPSNDIRALTAAMENHTVGLLAWSMNSLVSVLLCIWRGFYRASYASAVLGVVILSVHLSHACFVTNPKNWPAIFLYHTKGQSF